MTRYKKVWTAKDDEEIRNMREIGRTWEEIGNHFSVSAEAARGRPKNLERLSLAKGDPDPGQQKEQSILEQGDDFINIVCASRRMLTKDDVIQQFNIDLDTWEIERFKVKTSEGYRKDRKVKWQVEDGKVLQGDVEDTGKMLVVPMYHIEVRLVKKKKEIEARAVIQAMLEDARNFAPKYEKIIYPKHKDGLLYEIAMYDIHFGRLTWDEESGESYDIKLAETAVKSSLIKLLALVQGQPVSRILLPLGNDFFNVDSKFNTTTGGTPQQEDTRWQKTYRKGVQMCVWMIDTCSQIAPVDVIIVPGNHDQQRSFYLGETLDAWYNKSKDVTINNEARSQKYYQYGKVMLGFTHGNDIRLEKLPYLMAFDKPEMWAATKYREWHTGDKHHKKDLIPYADESSGMVIRIIRSLVASDAWTFNSGYRSLRASESFLWSSENGLIAQYTALPDVEQKGE